jgi:NADH-quinone oxidoreductase subunit E
MSEIIKLLGRFPDLGRDKLIPVLQEIQDEFGYLSEETVNELSVQLSLPASKIYGLATFYNQFRFAPPGKFHIRVCHGTGCHIEGSGEIIREIGKILKICDGETTRDGIFSLEVQSCIGACGQAPVMAVNDEYYDKVDKKRLKEIIRIYQEKGEE